VAMLSTWASISVVSRPTPTRRGARSDRTTARVGRTAEGG
jgi:hypothetical protein